MAVSGPLDRVTAPPYDVISDRRRLDYLRASPYSVVHLDLAEGSEDPADPASRYARAAHLLADWEERGVLVRSSEPRYFVYEMTYTAPVVDAPGGPACVIRGLLCAMDLEPWGGSIVPHEGTMDGPIQDRLRLLRATRTHVSAVYGLIDGPCEPLASLLGAAARRPAPYATVDEQGVTHRMWPLAPTDDVGAWIAPMRLLIADGHHRYTTALSYRDERHAAEGAGPWDRILTLIVDAGSVDVPVLPFHRLQTAGAMPAAQERDGERPEGATEALAACSDDEVVVVTVRRTPGAEIRYDRMHLTGGPPAVRALHEEILDRRAPAGSLRFVADAGAAIEAVRSGEAVGAYLLPPTTPARIRAVIERGERLPQKSTYFWPKPRTGMVMMPLDLPVAPPAVAPAS